MATKKKGTFQFPTVYIIAIILALPSSGFAFAATFAAMVVLAYRYPGRLDLVSTLPGLVLN